MALKDLENTLKIIKKPWKNIMTMCYKPCSNKWNNISYVQQPSDVDFRVMATFTEFYQTMLGFVLYRLFQSINLRYPPAIPQLPKNSSLCIESKKHPKDHIKFCEDEELSAEVIISFSIKT